MFGISLIIMNALQPFTDTDIDIDTDTDTDTDTDITLLVLSSMILI